MKTHEKRCPHALIFVFLVGLLMVSPQIVSEVEAQGLKKLRNAIGKMEDKVQEKKEDLVDRYIDDKISEKTEETLNKWFGIGSQNNKSSQGGMSSTDGASGFGAFGLNMNASSDEVYEFDYRISYLIESIENGKSTKMRMNTYLNSEQAYYAVQIVEISGTSGSNSGPADAYMIMDQKNSVMVMLINENGQRSSMVISLPQSDLDEQAESSSGNSEDLYNDPSGMNLSAGFNAIYGYESIGSRTISGYSTNGFRLQEGSSQIELWVSDDPIKGYKEMMKASVSVPMMAMFTPYATSGGMLVEITSNDDASNAKTMMRLEEGSGPESLSISMSQWPRVGF